MDKNGLTVGNRMQINDDGNPFDIISTPFGFYVMGANKTVNTAWISLYTY